MGKRATTSPFDFPAGVEDAKVRARAIALLKSKGVRLPTFAELAEPASIPKDVRGALGKIGPDETHPLNLYRVHWFNDADRRGQVATPVHVELPETLTGVKARIVVALGDAVPDDPRAQGAGGLRLPGAAAGVGAVRSGARSARCGRRRATTAAAASPSPRSWAAGAWPCCPRA